MSIRHVVTRGYGNGTFNGTIADVVTRGYIDVSAVSAAVTGTAAAGLTEADVVTGGKTVIITLTNDTWAATLGADNSVTDAFIAGFDSNQSNGSGWNNTVRDGSLTFGDVTRDSDTQVTVVLPATAGYDTDSDETITITLDATTLVTSSSDITATPTLSVTAAASVEPVAGDSVENLSGAGASRHQRVKKEQQTSDQDMIDMASLAIPEILKYLH